MPPTVHDRKMKERSSREGEEGAKARQGPNSVVSGLFSLHDVKNKKKSLSGEVSPGSMHITDNIPHAHNIMHLKS